MRGESSGIVPGASSRRANVEITEEAAEALETINSEMFMDYVLRTAEKLAESKGETVKVADLLKTDPIRDYAERLGVGNRYREAVENL